MSNPSLPLPPWVFTFWLEKVLEIYVRERKAKKFFCLKLERLNFNFRGFFFSQKKCIKTYHGSQWSQKQHKSSVLGTVATTSKTVPEMCTGYKIGYLYCLVLAWLQWRTCCRSMRRGEKRIVSHILHFKGKVSVSNSHDCSRSYEFQ